jgi:hypothetical protein
VPDQNEAELSVLTVIVDGEAAAAGAGLTTAISSSAMNADNTTGITRSAR